MNNLSRVSLACTLIVICANWSGQETSVDGPTKQAVNFKGTIVPQQGDPISVENISIGRMYKQIPVYQAPENQQTTKPSTNRLLTDPKEGIITRIDLSEINQIIVEDPDTLWSYQKNHTCPN